MRTLPTTEYEMKKALWIRRAFSNDNRLENLRFQGGYLYDKGENDERIFTFRFPQPIYKYILSCL